MRTDSKIIRWATAVTLVLLAPLAAAKEPRVLTWNELIPQGAIPEDAWSGYGNPVDHSGMAPAFSTPAWGYTVDKELDGQHVKLPGFIVPLEVVDSGKISAFLLVPYFGACMHYPPPPPNQIVHVTPDKPMDVESIWYPVWVTGEIKAELRSSELGEAGYTMASELVEDYED